MPDFTYSDTIPTQLVTAGSPGAAARAAADLIAVRYDRDQDATFSVWMTGPPTKFDVVVTARVQRTITVTVAP